MTETTVVKNEDDQINPGLFDHQCFLIHFYTQFMNKNEKFKYQNFSSITGEPALLMSKLYGTGVDEMFNILPSQLSLLQPKIRLFKTVYDDQGDEKDVELVFNDHFNEQSIDKILKSTGQKGFGIGLKSFEWDDMGTNPGDTGKAFQATLILHAQSLYDLFGEQIDKTSGLVSSFADLVRIPPTKFNTFGAYNNQYFRIKVQLGWQVPTDPGGSIISKTLRQSIEANQITLFLTLTDHDIDLREDGSAQITANYIGAIEGKMLSPETDILYVDKDIRAFMSRQENAIKYAKDQQAKTKKRIDETAKTDDRGFFDKSLDFFRSKSKDQLEYQDYQAYLEDQLLVKENIVRENRAISYKRFLTALENRKRIFYVDIDRDGIAAFQKLRSDTFSSQNLSPNQLEQEKAKKLQETRLSTKKTSFEVNQYDSAQPDNPFGNKLIDTTLQQTVKQKDERDREKVIADLRKQFSESKQAKEHDKTRINFLYLGDIIDIALNVVRGDEEQDKNISDKVKKDREDIRKNFRFILGPIELYNYQTQENEIKNLADIPISLDLFNAWFLKKVIRPQLDKYLLRDFLRDLCSELVIKAVSPDCLGPYSKATKNRISFSVFSLGGNDQDIFSKHDRLHLNDIERSEGQLARLRSAPVDQMKHYFMIYVSGYFPHKLSGDYDQDVNSGIYHLFFGSDRGLVKRIKFSKTDLQYLKEARIVNESETKKGDIFFVEPYNAKTDLFGTSIFKPGMMLYIDPKSIGMPRSVPKNKRIPLGGYYTVIKVNGRIEPGKFETVLDLNWESSGEERETTPYSQTTIKVKELLIDTIA